MKKGARFSDCRTYRYGLWRLWDEATAYAMFIGLNPSTADEINDDPTIKRCISYAKEWGYGGLMMANLFAYRATDPEIMLQAKDPIGPENDRLLLEYANKAGVVVGAWGNAGAHLNRASKVLEMLPGICYLKLNKTGHPAHPLYLSAKLKPKPFDT